MKEGDIFFTESKDSQGPLFPAGFYPWKVLKIDEGDVCHVSRYRPFDVPPTPQDISNFKPFILHSPIKCDGFGDSTIISNQPVTKDELGGYLEYLKRTNFQRYLKETGQNPDTVIAEANEAYNKARALSDEGKYNEANTYYTKAIDIFPLFFEATDNRGINYMDMGQFENAIESFQESIQINGHTLLTDFSIADCFLKLGKYVEAKEYIDKALFLQPENPHVKSLQEKIEAHL